MDHQPDDIRHIHIQTIVSPLFDVRELGPRQLYPMVSSDGWVDTMIDLPNNMCFRLGTYNGADALFSADKMHELGLDSFRLVRFANQTVAHHPDDGRIEGIVHLLLRNVVTHWERLNSVIGNYEMRDRSAVDFESWPGTLQTFTLG